MKENHPLPRLCASCDCAMEKKGSSTPHRTFFFFFTRERAVGGNYGHTCNEEEAIIVKLPYIAGMEPPFLINGLVRLCIVEEVPNTTKKKK